MNDRTIYERALEALVEKLEADNAALRGGRATADSRGAEALALLGSIVRPDNNETWLSNEFGNEWVIRAKALLGYVHGDGQVMAPPMARSSASGLYFHEHVSASPPVDEQATIATRASDAEKRAFLLERGWTCHKEIEDQNIMVCWENGAKWQSLSDAYELAVTTEKKEALREAGWESVTDPVDEIERWKRPGSDELLLFHVASAEIAA